MRIETIDETVEPVSDRSTVGPVSRPVSVGPVSDRSTVGPVSRPVASGRSARPHVAVKETESDVRALREKAAHYEAIASASALVDQQRGIVAKLHEHFRIARAELRRREESLSRIIGEQLPLFEQTPAPTRR